MHEYPIFKHLIQFSNLVDSDGKFLTEVPAGLMGPSTLTLPPNLKQQYNSEESDDYQEEDKDNFEGGDSEKDNVPPNNEGNGDE